MFVKVFVLSHMDGSIPTVEAWGPFDERLDADAYPRDPSLPSAELEFHLTVEVAAPS